MHVSAFGMMGPVLLAAAPQSVCCDPRCCWLPPLRQRGQPTPHPAACCLCVQHYVESEILNHSTLRHPHVVQFREVFLSPNHVSLQQVDQQHPANCSDGAHAACGSANSTAKAHGDLGASRSWVAASTACRLVAAPAKPHAPPVLPAAAAAGCCVGTQINIVMDFASGGSLFTYVQTRNRLREPLAR